LRILGIDPGTQRAGWAILDYDTQTGFVRADVVERKGEREDRLAYIWLDLTEIIARYMPDVVAIEKGFIGRNPQTALAIGQAQGVAIVAAQWHNKGEPRPVHWYANNTVKRSITGYGKASKEQVQAAALAIYGLPLDEDAADALAVAHCHLQQTSTMPLEVVSCDQD
jgi:crossover junction endodeoxyribonuclease RuvC